MARVAERVLTEGLDALPAGVLDAHITTLTESQASLFICRVRLRSAADADRARNEVTSVIASLSIVNLRFPGLPGPQAISGYRHAVGEATLQTVFGMESLETRALLRAGIVHATTGAQLAQILSTVQEFGINAVAAFADHYLAKEASRAVLLLPDDARAGGVTAAGGRPLPTAPPIDAASGTEPDIKEDDYTGDETPLAAVPPDSAKQATRVTTLANGLTVIVRRRSGLPVVSMLLGFHGDPRPGEIPGVRSALPRVVLWDEPFEPLDRGILHETNIDADSYQERLHLFSDDTRKALQLIADQPDQLRVHWPSPRFQRWTESEAQIEATPGARAWLWFREALLGTTPYRLTPTIDSIRTVTGAQILNWMQVVRRPGNGALVVVGDVDPDEVSRDAARLLAGWQGEAVPVPAPPPPVADRIRRPRMMYTPDERRRSAQIRFGCLLPGVHSLQEDTATEALAQLIELDLRRGLRFKRSSSYAPNVVARTRRGGTASVEGSLDVENTALPGALDVLGRWLEPDRQPPFQAADLDRVRGWLARRAVFGNATNARVASRLFYAWNLGLAPADMDDIPGALARMTPGDVTADLDACRASAVISVLGPGPFPPAAAPPPSN